jgi:hypothetical protein
MGHPRTDVRFDFVDKLPASVPPLEKQPTSLFPFPPPVGPNEATYYFPITALKKCNPTGVFFPANYHFHPVIDVILFFHGFKWPSGVPRQEFTNINEYWGGNLHNIQLREDINATGKKWVLIAPTLGTFPGSSKHVDDMGVFGKPTGGDDFLEQVRTWIGKYVPQYASRPGPKPGTTVSITPTIGKVVLAGHSGAGIILAIQAKGMKTPICEVWGFDSMYGYSKGDFDTLTDPLTDWHDIASDPSKSTQYFFHWVTTSRAKDLDDTYHLTNITVREMKHPAKEEGLHYKTLTNNFFTRVKDSSCFS